MAENVLWEGNPAQVTAWRVYLFSFVLALAGVVASVILGRTWPLILLPIAIVVAGYAYLAIRSRQYRLTTQRLVTRTGILTRRTDEIELYRVKDFTFVEPFLPRLLGLGTLDIVTSDQTSPHVVLRNIRGADKVKEQLRQQVESLRDKKRVREIDGLGDGGED